MQSQKLTAVVYIHVKAVAAYDFVQREPDDSEPT